MLTNSELNQIKDFLALYGKKDSQLSIVTNVRNADYVTIVQGSKNVRITVELLQKAILAGFVDPDNPAFSSLWDNAPQEDSSNPVRSSGIWHAINDNNVIDTNQIKNNAVTSAKIKNGEVKTNNIADKNVTEAKLSDDINNAISKYTHTITLGAGSQTLREIGVTGLNSTFNISHQIEFYGDRDSITVTPDSSDTVSNVSNDTVNKVLGVWYLYPSVGTHTLQHTSTYKGVTPSTATTSIALNLAKFFGYVPDNIISQGKAAILNYLVSNTDSATTKHFSNSVACTVDIKANGTGKKYAYFAVPYSMSISQVIQTASQLEFALETPVVENRTVIVDGNTYEYGYKLYKSVEKPDSDRAKNVRIS